MTTFLNVAFPIIKPGFGALAIFTFINAGRSAIGKTGKS